LLQKLEGKEVEFNDLAREALARLDNKIAILQRLLADAESTIARLQRTVAERDPCESVDAENSPSPRFPVSPCP
jgi:hypothetical protein